MITVITALMLSIVFAVSTPEDANAIKASAAVPLNDLPEDTLIARVLDQKIYLKDINPPQAQKEKYQKDKTPQQLTRWQSQHRRSNLGGYFGPLFEQYVEKQNIKASETEIEQYNNRMRGFMASEAEKRQKKINSLQKELMADNLDDEKRAELSRRLALDTKIVTDFEDYGKTITDTAESKERLKSRNVVAQQVIVQWKICNRLYEQYGGRVIFQQAGPEPLDAYRKFLEDEQSKGSFEFFNKEAEELFWEYYRNERMHAFYSDETEAKAMMATPWWLHEPEDSPDQDDANLWCEEVDGLCMKIRRKKTVFYAGASVTVIVDLLNTGDNEFSCSSCPQFFEIEVDGQWYQWDGAKAGEIPSFPLKSKKVNYEFAQITLTDQWISKESKVPLKLDLGPHSMRFRYKPMYINMGKSVKPVKATFAVTSNLMKFKIIPPKQRSGRPRRP